MISYPITSVELWKRINAHKPSWAARASAATAACQAAGKYVKTTGSGTKIDGLWGEIKEVFMDLQHDKCCYCERKLASVRYGKVEHDVEHYRPKSRVKNWFTPTVKKDLPDWPGILGQSGAHATGYYLLAFDPGNYATSCKECNSALKSDYFPCGKPPILNAANPSAAAAEEPWLIFPLGGLDEPAESLIQFEGILAQPVYTAAADPRRHWRARVTIRFFQLNVPSPPAPDVPRPEGRENLYRERASAISELADCLDALETTISASTRKQRENKVKRLIAEKSAHASCRRSFLKLWLDPATRQKAVEIWEAVETYLDS